jgi:hypothetical protein
MSDARAADCNNLGLSELVCLDAGNIGFSAIIALVALLFGLWMKLLGGETWRKRVGLWLYDGSWSTSYAGSLQNLLVHFRWFFGHRWSWRAFDVCFRFAVIYTVWYQLFLPMIIQNGIAGPIKWFLIGGMFAAVLLLFRIARWIRRRHLRARRGTERRKRRIWLFLREALAHTVLIVVVFVVLTSVAYGLIFAVSALGLSEYDHGLGTVLLILFIASILPLAGVGAGAGIMAGIGIGTLTVALLVIMAFNDNARSDMFWVGAGLIAALVILAQNALFDWLSSAKSRWLISRLREDAARRGFFRRTGAVLAHHLLDITLAIVCLFGLAIIVTNTAKALLGFAPVDGFLYSAKAPPFSAEGSVMTVMLASTLVPTALHIFFALFSLAAIRPPCREWFVGWTEDDQSGGEWGNRAIVSAYLTFWVVFALGICD